jgi:hypothetical protein
LVQDMYYTAPEATGQARAMLAAGTAAMFTLFAYPPAAHPLWAGWQCTGQPPDPRAELIPRWVTAVTGPPLLAEGLRRLIAEDDRAAELPPDVDWQRFGGGYRASDPVHLAVLYTVVCRLMLAAQELMYRQLGPDERDAYCAGVAAAAGYVFGLGAGAPADYATLCGSYEAILAGRLQGTGFGRAALGAMLAGVSPAPLPLAVIRQAAQLTDERVSSCLSLTEAVASAAIARSPGPARPGGTRQPGSSCRDLPRPGPRNIGHATGSEAPRDPFSPGTDSPSRILPTDRRRSVRGPHPDPGVNQTWQARGFLSVPGSDARDARLRASVTQRPPPSPRSRPPARTDRAIDDPLHVERNMRYVRRDYVD